ncbi:MAG: glycoside hydrolase family 2 [Bacteroidetes bacterium]|nr:glycoside hydrolase family 2 [Bacteroidota bacterium]MDA1121580.1 glycoside hydrolase family 2 [Bacteroidota bacterium]
MKHTRLLLSLICILFSLVAYTQGIPLPEHPRPDFERSQWQNLNGVWQFGFDGENLGLDNNWVSGEAPFPKTITVPFPWGSNLSGVQDEADIAWYMREITVSPDWQDKRTFVTIGASDWETTVWLDGQLLGTHQGGYTPFSFELTAYLKYGQAQKLIIRADDARRDFTLYGKQGYGNARGIWQTVYLEARGTNYLDAVHFTPDIDNDAVTVTAYLPEEALSDLNLEVRINNGPAPISAKATFPKGMDKTSFKINIPDAHLWSLEDPFLYDTEIKLADDVVKSYFGMRKISVVDLPGTDYPYIALNNNPIYLQLSLDQSYHPDGFYTFPSDQFMKEEIERSKSIGLNGNRIHIKVEVPRKLYWADKLGLLIMADLPNSWGEPDVKMQAEATNTLREMIKRDYNHPSIFSWITFNETWGLRTAVEENGKKVNKYLPKTQDWVASMYYLTKSLDQTRLVEDNSICCGAGHTETDINSWHAYLPGWEWESYMKNIDASTFPGSTFDFEDGFKQGRQPNINSECGNVWGYDGSTGDVDWSWDYHRMMNTFRKYPKMAGWLYTEHHDVINEWNGYWRFDRTEKETGVGDLVTGMTVNDFHSPVYLSTGNEISLTATAGETVTIPLYLSSMTGENYGTHLIVSYDISHTNYIGETTKTALESFFVDYKPFIQSTPKPLQIKLPNTAGLSLISFLVETVDGKELHRNFMVYEITSGEEIPKTKVVNVSPNNFTAAEWSKKQWDVLDGLKVNGAGRGYFEYTFDVSGIEVSKSKEAYFLIEVSSKELFAKDRETFDRNKDYMKGARAEPSSNPNSYPMSDEAMFPSTVSISMNGSKVQPLTLPDDPADHRGMLSWHHQLKDKKLREAGSYGYLTKVAISKRTLKEASDKGKLVIRITAQGEGGIAVYGKSFGRYPFDPSLVVKY